GSIQYNQGSIVKKALTITANNHLIVYDGKVYSGGNGVTYSGFVAGENENDLSGHLVYNGSSQTAIDAGLYEIMPDGLSSINYEITYLPGVLTISGGAENTLSFNIFNDGQLVQHTYGGNDLDASAVASSGLPVTYSSSDENVAQIDANGQVRIIGVGTTTITITQAGNINYETADPISV